MSRAQRSKRLGSGATKSAAAPSGDSRDGNGVQRRTGTERPDPPKDSPRDISVKAAVIKTNS